MSKKSEHKKAVNAYRVKHNKMVKAGMERNQKVGLNVKHKLPFGSHIWCDVCGKRMSTVVMNRQVMCDQCSK